MQRKRFPGAVTPLSGMSGALLYFLNSPFRIPKSVEIPRGSFSCPPPYCRARWSPLFFFFSPTSRAAITLRSLLFFVWPKCAFFSEFFFFTALNSFSLLPYGRLHRSPAPSTPPSGGRHFLVFRQRFHALSPLRDVIGFSPPPFPLPGRYS